MFSHSSLGCIIDNRFPLVSYITEYTWLFITNRFIIQPPSYSMWFINIPLIFVLAGLTIFIN